MALIACPDCRKPVSDQARSCPYCGLPVALRLAQMRQEEEARQAEEEVMLQHLAERRERYVTFLVVAGILFIFLIAACVSSNQRGQNASTAKVLYENQSQANITPGAYPFLASGKLKLEYTCQTNTKNSAKVQLTLVSVHASSTTTVWKKSLNCSPKQWNGSETIQVKSDSYDVGATVSGDDATWNLKITQQ